MEFIIVTGMSGAGKSKAIDVLEDIGFFCVDNVPPQLLGRFADLQKLSGGTINKIAVVVDARGREMFRDFLSSLRSLNETVEGYKILFLDASDGVLLKRYKEGRRKHPLLGGDTLTLQEAIAAERELLHEARQRADYVVDTSLMAPSQLREYLIGTFLQSTHQAMLVRCMSFGFKNGLPAEADLVFDVRCLPNPFYVPELKAHTGLAAPVRDYVFQWPQSHQLAQRLCDLLDFLIPLYLKEGKSQLVVAIGCTGGRHRSVAFAERLSGHLQKKGLRVVTSHRDKDKPNQY